MDLTIPDSARAELAAAFLQAAITLGLAVLCGFLYRNYRKPYFGWLALAWSLYALRLGAIISFLVTENRTWLYWHQVTTGWTALGLLWAALVFSQQLQWRREYLGIVLFPPLWSYFAIYRLDNFLLAATPAVLFLSVATFWAGWAFLRYHRQVGSVGAVLLAASLLLWAIHHLDYPFLRARGVWNPWGYYLDIVFELAMGAGILVLVLEDVRRGLGALSALSGDLQKGGAPYDVLRRLLDRTLALPGVRGSAMYLEATGAFVRGAGLCTPWAGTEPNGSAAQAIARAVRSGYPEVVRDAVGDRTGGSEYAYAAALPVLRESAVTGAMVLVGDARDPFAALDTPFLLALGHQVGAALESADLYRRLEDRTHELERLATRMVRQHEEERRRLSRELHDETAQVFSAVKLQLGVLRESADPALAGRLDHALTLMDTGIQGIRNLTNDLRPALLDDLGLVPALRALVAQFGEPGEIETRIEAPEALPTLSDEAEVALFRALQEGLANVARHAHARSVVVTLGTRDGTVLLSVRDDGRGLDDDANGAGLEGRMGIVGMRERITALGGAVILGGAPGGGVELTVQLPVDRPA